MSETTKQALEQFVTQMLAAAQTGANWTAEQAPLVVQEWLRWRMVENIAYALLLVVPMIGAWKLGGAIIKCATPHDDGEPLAFGWAIRILGCGVMVLLSAGYVLNAIQVLVAPRVVVLEKFAELIK